MRVFIVLGGITFAVSQIVPLWMGRSLLDAAGEAEAPGVDLADAGLTG